MTDNIIENIVRIGTVSSVDVDNRTAKVSFTDKSNMVSGELKVLQNHPLIAITKTENGAKWNFEANYASVDRNLGLGESYKKEIPDTINLDRTIDYHCPEHGIDDTKLHTHNVEVHPWLPYIGQMVICLYIPYEDGDGFVLGGLSKHSSWICERIFIMAVIGNLGDIVFSVSRRKIKTFDSFKWDVSARYATHDRHMKDSLLEKVGNGVEQITFTMLFSVLLGTDPWSELQKMRRYVRNGKMLRLVLGGRSYGEYKWVIDQISFDMQRFDNRGRLIAAKLSVTLKSYVRR